MLYSHPHGRSLPARQSYLFVLDISWLNERVQGLLRTRQSAAPAALQQIRLWHPRFAERTNEEIGRAAFTVDDARLVYARQHGFESWAELTAQVRRLADDPEAAAAEPFYGAFQALQAGDVARLQALLRVHPDLAQQRGTNGNTLLNLAVSLAGQPQWEHGTDAVGLLLAAGADANDGNDRGWTPLHQAAYANRPALVTLLLEAGAAVHLEAHGSGGTPLIVALFWGHRKTARLLAAGGVVPNNLRAAAGLGDVQRVEACFADEHRLTDEACGARGFYRPHSGFPDWQPSTDPQEVLDEALVWACKSDSVEVLERLQRAGARLDADPYRGTPLLWAAACNRMGAAEWLLQHGARVNRQATFGGVSHGQGITALHIAAQYGHLGMVKLLLEHGADRGIREHLYNATAEASANHFGQAEVRDYLRYNVA